MSEDSYAHGKPGKQAYSKKKERKKGDRNQMDKQDRPIRVPIVRSDLFINCQLCAVPVHLCCCSARSAHRSMWFTKKKFFFYIEVNESSDVFCEENSVGGNECRGPEARRSTVQVL